MRNFSGFYDMEDVQQELLEEENGKVECEQCGEREGFFVCACDRILCERCFYWTCDCDE